MVFWYDMSKPVDTYIPSVTYANVFVNDGGKLTYDKTINKCIITHTPKGRLGYDSIQITSDGEYDVNSYTNSSTTNTSYPGFYLAGDNVNDVDCNIVVEEIPTRQSVPTKQNDGFTEQDLIDYVLKNIITQ